MISQFKITGGINTLIVFVGMSIFLLPISASAATYTVCTSGCSEATIQAVFDNNDLAPGDIVEIQADTPGGSKTYNEMITWGSNDVGDATNQVTLQGRSGDTVTIDGENTRVNAITSAGSGFDYITVSNLIVQNATGRNIFFEGASGIEDQQVNIINVTSIGSVDGIVVRNKSNSTYRGLVISGASQDAFQVWDNGTSLNNVTIGDITITGGNNSTGSLYLNNINGLIIDDDITVTSSTDNSIRLSNLGSLTVNSGVTVSAVNSGAVGIILHTSTAPWNILGTFQSINAVDVGIKLQTLDTANKSFANLITTGSGTNGIYINNSDDLTVSNFTTTGNGTSGVYVSNGSAGIVLNGGIISANIHDGITSMDTSTLTVQRSSIFDNGGSDGIPTTEGDGLTGHGTSFMTANYNLIYSNDNTCFAFINDSNLTAYNNICYSNGVSGGPRSEIWTDNDTGTLTVKNNIVSEGLVYEILAYDVTALGTLNEDYNQFYHPVDSNFSTTDNGATIQTSLTGWQTASSQDANSGESNPLFASSTPSLAVGFQLQQFSPAIDAGTGVGLTSDYAGNSIYGTPDIGAYEYQPPYTIGTDSIPTTGSARIYTDGKYRMKTATTTGAITSFTVTPLGGSYQATTTQYMDITIDTWATTGNKNKQWTATSTAGSFMTHATTTVYTVGDLLSNTYYQFKLDGTASSTAVTGSACNSNGVCLSDSSGQIVFNYVGGYSTHIFALEKDTTVPSSFSLGVADNTKTSKVKPTLSWGSSSDPSGLSKYQLYIDGTLDTDNISSSATSATPTNSLNCGNHTWRIRAIDNAGNTTDSSTNNITMACGGGVFTGSASSLPGYVKPRMQTIYSDGTVVYLDKENTEVQKDIKTEKLKDKKVIEKIQNLKDEEIKKQISIITTTHTFTESLYRTVKSEEVIKLQQTLRELGFFTYLKNTGYYGEITEEAVKQFQCKYDVVCSGSSKTTGYGVVGPRTRGILNDFGKVGEEVAITTSNSIKSEIIRLQKLVKDLEVRLKDIISSR